MTQKYKGALHNLSYCRSLSYGAHPVFLLNPQTVRPISRPFTFILLLSYAITCDFSTENDMQILTGFVLYRKI